MLFYAKFIVTIFFNDPSSFRLSINFFLFRVDSFMFNVVNFILSLSVELSKSSPKILLFNNIQYAILNWLNSNYYIAIPINH